MNGKIFLILSWLISYTGYGATPSDVVSKLDKKIITLSGNAEVQNLYGEIKFSNLHSMLNNKLIIEDSSIVSIFFYWSKQGENPKLDIEIRGDISSEIKNHIRSSVLSKVNIFLGQYFREYLGSDELTYKGKMIQALDISGREANEKLIDYKGTNLSIIEKKPSGTITTKYTFKEKKEGLLLVKVHQRAFEGIQAVDSTSLITYDKKKKYRFPVKIETKLEQKLFRTAGDDLEVTREIAETIEFTNVEINSERPLLWFSRK